MSWCSAASASASSSPEHSCSSSQGTTITTPDASPSKGGKIFPIPIPSTTETYRCGSPTLMILPLCSDKAPQITQERYAEAGSMIRSWILKYIHEEDLVEVGVCSRYPPGAKDNQVTTLLIVTKLGTDSSSGNWMKCINTLQPVLRGAKLWGVTIEIVAENLTLPRVMIAVERTNPFGQAWQMYLRRQILILIATKHKELDRRLLSLDLVQFAFERYHEWPGAEYYIETGERDLTPFIITVSGTVDKNAREAQWIHAQKDIVRLIKKEGFDGIAVEFERGSIFYCETIDPIKGPPIPTYTKKVDAGALFGTARCVYNPVTGRENDGLVGTMGGYLALEEYGQRRVVGVTNYHVVRGAMEGWALTLKGGEAVPAPPADGTPLKDFDSNPLFSTNEERKNMKLEFPSTKNLLIKIDEIDQLLQQTSRRSQIKRYTDERARLTALLGSDRTFAVPYMTSALKRVSIDNHRLNWALVEIREGRRGRNIDTDDELIEGIQPPESIPDSHLVFKRGGISGNCKGKFTCRSGVRPLSMDVRAALPDEEIPITDEYTIVTEGGRFAMKRDSGSFITYDGKWVGLLWGGSTKLNAEGQWLAYMTPATDVLRDIEDVAASRGRTVKASLPTEADMES